MIYLLTYYETIVLTGGGAAATAFQNEMRHHDGNWDFSPQQLVSLLLYIVGLS